MKYRTSILTNTKAGAFYDLVISLIHDIVASTTDLTDKENMEISCTTTRMDEDYDNLRMYQEVGIHKKDSPSTCTMNNEFRLLKLVVLNNFCVWCYENNDPDNFLYNIEDLILAYEETILELTTMNEQSNNNTKSRNKSYNRSDGGCSILSPNHDHDTDARNTLKGIRSNINYFHQSFLPS